MPRSNECWPKNKGRTRCGDDHWGVKDGDVSNLEVLSSYCLCFFFGGGRMKNQFRFFLILCFWMLVKKVALDHFSDWRSLLDDVQHHPCS